VTAARLETDCARFRARTSNEMSQLRATPPETIAQAQQVRRDVIPSASSVKYNSHYELYRKYLLEHGGSREPSDDNVLGFYSWMGQPVNGKPRYAASTRGSVSSALKTMLFANHAFSKTSLCWTTIEKIQSDVMKKHVPKKAETHEVANVETYFKNAPSTDQHLVCKAAVSLGIACGTRGHALYELQQEDVVRKADGGYTIKFNHEKQVTAHVDRVKELSPHDADKSITHPTQWLDAYLQVRGHGEGPFFMQLRNGKLYNERVGQKTIAGHMRTIAEWLNVPEPEKFTGHGTKRFAASSAVSAGMTGPQMQAHFGWKSAATAQIYNNSDVSTKRKATDLITAVRPQAAMSTSAAQTGGHQVPSLAMFAGATFNAPVHINMSRSGHVDVIDESTIDIEALFEEFVHKKAKK
jgi:integrase